MLVDALYCKICIIENSGGHISSPEWEPWIHLLQEIFQPPTWKNLVPKVELP